MALRAMYKGFKKVLAPLIVNRPGELAIDQDALNTELNTVFFPRSEEAVLGAGNFFDYLNATIQDYHVTHDFITNGIHVASSEAGNWSNVAIIIPNLYKNTDRVFKCHLDYVSGTSTIAIKGNNSIAATGDTLVQKTYSADVDVVLPFNTGDKNYLVVQLLVTANTGGSGELSATNMQISLSAETPYAPYTETNKQLTDEVATLNGSAADQKTAINAIITAATEAADFAAFKTAMGAITPVTRSIQVTPETREEITDPEEEPVKKTTRKKSTAKADTEKEGE